MTTPTFTYVEDYIEFIAGYRDITGKQLGLFDTLSSPISLARYDVSIVDSMAEQTAFHNKAYTDKQAALASRIVEKYRRQFSQLKEPVVLPEKLDQYRLGIRYVDRSKKIYIHNDTIHVKFPYDTKLIEIVKTQARAGKGSAAFNADDREWHLALTEDMINWSVTIGGSHEFEISNDVMAYYNKILEKEKEIYKIELVKTDSGYTITNAANSLIDYINEHHGGFGADNLMQLIDMSEVLGYTVDKLLYAELFNRVDSKIGLMISRRKHTFKQDSVSMDQVLDYARQVNRLPIHVYETGLPRPDTEEIIYLNRNADANISPRLLVSKSSLMVGTKKQAWIANAEKIFIIE
jgi:hypothetical protein